MKIKTTGLYLRMVGDALAWFALTFFAYNADWTKSSIVFGILGVLVLLWEIFTLFRIHRFNKEQSQDPSHSWTEEDWAEYHSEEQAHQDYDDRQDSSHFEA